jgi:predicted aspartyl protease
MNRILLCLGATLVAAATTVATAQAPETPPDPYAVLGAAKTASGGRAWDRLRTQHSNVTLNAGGMTGKVERWSDLGNGRSYLTYSLGPMSGAIGYDGETSWSQDQSGQSRAESAQAARELAVNAAFRDKLGFWFADRGRAAIDWKARAQADGSEFDVITVTPEGGRPFELWVNTETRMIERLVEQEQGVTRTEAYSDFREVEKVKVPFRVRASRGDPKYDELILVDSLEYNVPLDKITFTQPSAPKADFVFPAGKSAVELPFELHSGHIYVQARLNGKGPYTMLFDTGGINVLFPSTAKALGLQAEGALPGAGVGEDKQDVGLVRVAKLEIGGIAVSDQVFATIALEPFVHRVEGLDNVGGLVGYELLKRFPVRIDYERALMTFYDPATFKYAGKGERVAFRFHEHVPQVQGSVDGVSGNFDIDTGARTSLTLTSPFVASSGLGAKLDAKTELIAGVGVGGPARARLARVGVLRLGEVEVARPVTYLSLATRGAFADPALAGNVGFGVLRQFNIVFDYANEALWFEKNANFGQPDVHDRAGVWVERGAKGYELVEVVPGGPAAEAGLKAGDVVTTVDGKPVSAVSLAQFRTQLKAAPGTKVRVTLASGKSAVVTLRDLI